MNFGADEQQQTLLGTCKAEFHPTAYSDKRQRLVARNFAKAASNLLPKCCKGPPNRSSTKTTLAGFLIQQMDLVILHRIASGIRFPTVTAAKVHNNKNAQKSTDDIETQYHMTHLLNGKISIAQTCDSAVNLIGRIVRLFTLHCL
ncbi:conserved hypothetical protein [Trichinella spiralis]|uniref:hypothetical protein n=1 Tax=Trichinella spiralis TaxID=6334 RepID=UPI0001EFD536|nr:conserved hypothetical protein [Trichinella spiralis]